MLTPVNVEDALSVGNYEAREVKFKVFRHSKFLYETNDDFDESFCQEHYGGGFYTVKVFVNGLFDRNVQVLISEPIRRN